MARSRRPLDTPSLFDLPLGPEPAAPAAGEEGAPDEAEDREPDAAGRPFPAAPSPPVEAEGQTAAEGLDVPGLPLFTGGEAAAPAAPAEEADPPRPRPPALVDRFRAGLADLALHAAVGLALLVGAELMGAQPGLAELPALALFLFVFSFFYMVIPLAFWGQTPGMGWTSLVIRAEGDQSPTLGQTVRRWLGVLLTVALLGLPTLLAAGGRRSLADLLSGTETLRVPPAP